MIRRIQFQVLSTAHALEQFIDALKRMPRVRLYVTIETEDQYAKLRSKLAKRAAKKRRRAKLGYDQ